MTDNRLDDLVAKQECIELIYILARGLDRCDADLIASVYHDDATDDHGLIKGTIQEFVAGVIPMLRGMTRTSHNITNVLVKVSRDRARGEAYFIAQHTIGGREAGEHETEMFAAGRYLDRFERRDGVWKIAHRHAVYDWTMTIPASGGWDGPPMRDLLLRGERGTGDASYAHFAG
jgi:ketosteroid isomerase-like protein